jgi:hypothetical protein
MGDRRATTVPVRPAPLSPGARDHDQRTIAVRGGGEFAPRWALRPTASRTSVGQYWRGGHLTGGRVQPVPGVGGGDRDQQCRELLLVEVFRRVLPDLVGDGVAAVGDPGDRLGQGPGRSAPPGCRTACPRQADTPSTRA